MKLQHIVRTFLQIAVALAFFGGRHSEAQLQNVAGQACPHTIDSTGKYVNAEYGFSIIVPTGLKGIWSSARCVSGKDGCVCMSDHGRIIPLAKGRKDSDHWIEAYAGFPAELDEPTMQNAVSSRLDLIRERSRDGSISVLQQSDISIGGAGAKRVVVRYHDKESNRVMVEDFVEVLRGEPVVAMEYSLYLRAPVETYDRDRTLFERVLSSFELTTCEECP